MEAGITAGPMAPLDSAVSDDENLIIHSAFYAFSIGDGNLSVTGAPLVDQDDVIAATASLYSDSFIYRHCLIL